MAQRFESGAEWPVPVEPIVAQRAADIYLLPEETEDEMRQRVPRSWKDILD